jgi:hypothetical protein
MVEIFIAWRGAETMRAGVPAAVLIPKVEPAHHEAVPEGRLVDGHSGRPSREVVEGSALEGVTELWLALEGRLKPVMELAESRYMLLE